MNKKRGLLIWSFDFGQYWVDLASRAGLTTLGLHPIPDIKPEDPRSAHSLLRFVGTDAFRETAGDLRERGIDLEFELHAMHLLLPQENTELHPEWFRMNEAGVRCFDSNFCPSRQEALQVVEDQAERLAQQLVAYTPSHRYYFWIDDNGQYCHCDRCKGHSPSDQALIIYNRILKGIRRADPLGTQCYLAYQATIAAPTSVRPDPGLFLEYAPINRDSGFAMNDSSCLKNASEAAHIKQLLECFGKEGSQVLEYWMDNSRHYRWIQPFGEMPFYGGVLRKDVEYYAACGFESITSFACGLNQEYAMHYGEPPVVEYGRTLREGGAQ